jgi:hypothetical protein
MADHPNGHINATGQISEKALWTLYQSKKQKRSQEKKESWSPFSSGVHPLLR